MTAAFTFISVGYVHDGQEVVVSLEQMRKHCRAERVADLLADLAILCEDVELGRVPLERLPVPEPQAPEDITKESIEAEFPGWSVWQGIDNRWCARVIGATPPVMVSDDDLVGLREEIIRKLSKTDEYWAAEGRVSSTE